MTDNKNGQRASGNANNGKIRRERNATTEFLSANKKKDVNKKTMNDVVYAEKAFTKPKRDFSDLLKSKYVKKWIENYQSDKQARLSLLTQFCEYIEKTPEQLILEHYDDVMNKPLEKTHIGKKQLMGWFESLKDDGKSHNAARQYAFSKLTSFYARNDVPISFQKGEIPAKQKGVKDKVWRQGDKRIPFNEKKATLKNLRDAFSTIRDRAIFLSKLSTGIDDVDLFVLKVKDYKRGYYDDKHISYVEGNRIKPQGNPYYQGFFSGEACNAIDIYIKHRENKGEIIDDNSDLFISERMTADGKPKKIKATAFSEAMNKITDQLGLENITPKKLRSWFSTTLKRGGIEHDIVERMMGHVGDVSKEYQEIFDDPEEFSEMYAEKCEGLISLGNGNKKYVQLENELKELRAKVDAFDEREAKLKQWFRINLAKHGMHDITELDD